MMAFEIPSLPAKKPDWRKLASYANPQSIKDLDNFLDKLPARVGMNNVVAASVIWAIAGLALFLAYSKSVDLRALNKELSQVEALLPPVPSLQYAPVPPGLIKDQVDKMKLVYKTITIDAAGGNVTISAASTRDFAAWRAALGDLAYGGGGWRVQIKEFCAGRDCANGKPLQAVLSVQQMDITLSHNTAS